MSHSFLLHYLNWYGWATYVGSRPSFLLFENVAGMRLGRFSVNAGGYVGAVSGPDYSHGNSRVLTCAHNSVLLFANLTLTGQRKGYELSLYINHLLHRVFLLVVCNCHACL